jgi:uncharacterized membrane protein YciS (DUF1049 family)
MIFQSLLQLQVFGFMLFAGMICGLLFEVLLFICALFKNNKYLRFVLQLIYSLMSFGIYFIAVSFCNFGEFRFFTIIATVMGIFIVHFALGYLLSKLLHFLYNFYLKCYSKRIKRRKSHDTKQT